MGTLGARGLATDFNGRIDMVDRERLTRHTVCGDAESSYQQRTAQDARDRNFVPKRDFTRYD